MTRFSKLTEFIVTGSAAELAQLKGPIGGALGSVVEFRQIEAGFHKP